ncbi:MAG: 50S ribosomal protein L10 [Methanomicrobiales archaeon]|nr:50S ribosomal protein L10 [Methanomicrobiales archaeon]
MPLYTKHLPKWKRDEIEEIKRHATGVKLVGLVDVEGIPAIQLQQIRRSLHGRALLKMTRNTLIDHAFTEMGGSISEIRKHIAGQSALLFTDENPFALYKMLEKTKTKMAAKPGQTAPYDIVVEKGPTSFKPGPIVGTLQQVGIPAMIEASKVKIRETKVVLRKGEVINKKMAEVLALLDVKPMDVGLVLQAAYYDHMLFTPEMLAIDEQVYLDRIALAASQAFNLSMNLAIPTRQTIEPLLSLATMQARQVAVSAAVYERGVIDAIIAKAGRESLALKSMMKEN